MTQKKKPVGFFFVPRAAYISVTGMVRTFVTGAAVIIVTGTALILVMGAAVTFVRIAEPAHRRYRFISAPYNPPEAGAFA